MSINPKSLFQKAHNVASLPMIYARINEVVNRPSSSMSDIATIIIEDTGLSARILRLANSAFYGYPTQIDTIDRALTVIGLQQMRDLALATSIMQLFKDVPEELINMNSFWEHSIACGVAARVLAMHRREPNVEKFFLGGVLHDLGRLILFQHAPQEMTTVLEKRDQEIRPLVEVEKMELDIDHGNIGGIMMANWKLPDNLSDMVALHHRPAATSRFPESVATIHLADILAITLGLGSSGEKYVPILKNEAWSILNLSPQVLPMVADQIKVQYESAISIILKESGE